MPLVNSGKNNFQDPYIDQSSGCLRNLLGIKDSEELSKVETSLVLNRCYELELISIYNPSDKKFNFQHLQDIHKHLFQDIYEWAGQVRHVDISKDDTRFDMHQLIDFSASAIFYRLESQNYLKGSDATKFSKNAGHYMRELNQMHPFREGNGRTQRVFINLLAHNNGYHIEWKNISQKQLIEAYTKTGKGDPKPLAALIRENLVDRDLALAINQDRSFDGRGTRIFPAETGKKYDGTIIGVTERQVMQALINSPDHVIIHDRRSLTRIPDIDKRVEISYPHGDIGLVREPEILKEKDSSKTHNLEKNSYQHEDHEWER